MREMSTDLLPHSAFDLCLSASLFLSDGEVAPNIILNVQHGTNHLGPEDLELMLEEVTQNTPPVQSNSIV